MNNQDKVTGWYVFAGVLLFIGGLLNIVYGIGAIGDSKFFTPNATFILSGLHTWGWITLIIGVIQLIAAFSLFAGNTFGRVVGIVGATLAAIATLVTINLSPFWGICMFFLAITVIWQLAKTPDSELAAN